MISLTQKSDNVGALASTICLIHCIATPFIFIAQSCSVTCCSGVPSWWRFIDYFFLIISFFAIYRSTQTTTKNWMKPVLWINYLFLLVVILNEKMVWFVASEKLVYIPAITLVILHLYNRKYCQCSTETTKCCASEA